jgi:ATP-dependent DNA ligase
MLNFIEPMYARLVNELLAAKKWLYEVKFDGYYSLWIVSLIGSIFTDELLAT